MVNCKTWLNDNNCTMMRCPIQAENAEEIGWLAYSSQYSSKEDIAKKLEEVAGFEVGVRLASIATKAEHKLDWKKKTRGLIVVVPAEKASIAKKKFNNVFRARKEHNYENPNPVLDLFHQFSFLPLESEIAKLPNCKTNYAVCLRRHQIHYRSIQARFMPDLLIDIDRKLNTRLGWKSVRDMILNIKSTDPKMKGARLFQGLDKIKDSSKVYFPYNKQVGSGEEGYIFQFYQCLEEEANMMFQGLGVYLEQEYEIDNMHAVLGMNHWDKNEHWTWDCREKKFITPEEQISQELVQFDGNAMILDMEAKHLELLEQQSSVNVANNNIQRQQEELVNILQNPDLDPITTLNQPIQTLVDEINVNDQVSAASSLTYADTDNPNDASSQRTKVTANKNRNEESSTSSSIGSMGTKTMRDLIDPKLSAAENCKRIASSTALRMNRLQQRQVALDKELEAQQLAKESNHQEIEMEKME